MIHLRYGHCDGHTDLCYSQSSTSFITCGSEGDVRVWEDIDDTDQKDLCIGEKAWAVCQRGKTLYVATDKNIVQAYTFPDLEADGIITRFTAPVTQIDISPDEKKLAAGSCDMDIHVVDMDSMESRTLSGHKAPILSISLDPRLSFLASSSCDGSVKIWSLNSGDVINQWDSYVDKSNSFERSESLCRLHFEPIHGRFLAIPVKNKILIYERETWALVKTLVCSLNDHIFSVIRYSKCGKYLAGGTVKGKIYIFNVKTEKIIDQTSDQAGNISAITAISWHSSSSGVIYSNINGQIGELLVSSAQHNTEDAVTAEDLGDVPLGVPDFEDDDDEDSENVISLEKIKAESGFGQNRLNSPAQDDKDDKESLVSDRVHKFEPSIPFAQLQESFQPSSTPIHLQERFLVWNSVGIVRGFNREDGIDELDIEFHDTATHHGFRMSNSSGYLYATLTEQAFIIASPRLGELPSKLKCILLKSWDGQKEWEVSLGVEEATGVAAGNNWVAVSTDRNILRIYSVDGTQTDILSIPGPLISFVGYSNLLAVYFHSAQGSGKDQFISYMLISINSNTKLAAVLNISPLPITPQSTIKWVGFSDEGSLTTLDSEGFLRLLYDKQWRPISSFEERAKSKFDHYFILGLSEKTHTVRCILCKGAYYPPVIPKPIVNEIEWQIPLSDLDTDRGKLEEEMLRAVVTVSNLQLKDDEDNEAKNSIEKTISVTVMKLFALACRTGLESRAVSLCESMPSVDVVKLASKYAAKLGRHQLATRVADVASQMAEEVNNRLLKEMDDDNCKNDLSTNEHISTPTRQQGASSQDIFADHNESVRNPSKLSDKENLIMKMRRKKAMSQENNEPKPSMMNGLQHLSKNPFKKVASEEENVTVEKDIQGSPKPNYIDWFNENKSDLQSEHPLLNDSELAIIGIKKYRQLNSSVAGKGDSPNTTPSVPPVKHQKSPSEDGSESKKRKLMETTDESAKKKPIAIIKKTTPNEKKSVSEKKPLSAASKLKNFSFSKKSS